MKIKSAIFVYLGVVFFNGDARAQVPSISYAPTIGQKNFRNLDPKKGYILLEGDRYYRTAFAKIDRVNGGADDVVVDSAWQVQPKYHLQKNSDESALYLLEVEPGEYAIYGLTLPVEGGGVTGICACMGSISFKVPEGRVTSVGAIQSLYMSYAVGDIKIALSEVMRAIFDQKGGMQITRRDLNSKYISKHDIVVPKFSLIQRLPNWYGLLVDRIKPISGVFDYERDRQIGAGVDSPAPR